MNLYVLRHAIAVDSGLPGYEDDSQRPLTGKGRSKMRKAARGMARLGIRVDLILSSPYLRARETADVVAEVLDLSDKLVFTENLTPLGYLDELITEINRQYLSIENLMLVGHEPSLSGLISTLLSGDSSLMITLKKGGLCKLLVSGLKYDRCATLEWLLYPSQLVAIGESR